MIHTVPHLITGARKGGQRQIWWPCSSGGSMAVSRTSDTVSVYGSQHNEWSKVWFKWASPDPSNCSPLSVITTLGALCLGLLTGSGSRCCYSIFLFMFDFSLLGEQPDKHTSLCGNWTVFCKEICLVRLIVRCLITAFANGVLLPSSSFLLLYFLPMVKTTSGMQEYFHVLIPNLSNFFL